MTREELARLDSADPLAQFRGRFALPQGLVYLDGNSLGPLPRATAARIGRTVGEEWGEGLIRSWNAAGWIDLPRRVGEKISRLIGAGPGEVVAGDSTSVNLFKVLAVALAARSGRRAILSERDNFPTDLYIAQGLIGLLGHRHELRLVEPSELLAAIDGDTAVVLLTHVNYRNGAMHDMAAVTHSAHEQGSLAIWDLAHSAGAVPLDLHAAGADFAVGCGYKYLNGGPGAPAFVFVAKPLQEPWTQPLSGWLGHAAPFAFEPAYRPAPGIGRYVCGTPPVLSMAALEEGVDLLIEADMERVREKSIALCEAFIALAEERCGGMGLALASPRDAASRGSQVSFRHAEAYAVMQALIGRGVIGDFRVPDILRFGLAPLYVRFVDVWDAVEALHDVLATRAWDRAEFRVRGPNVVT